MSESLQETIMDSIVEQYLKTHNVSDAAVAFIKRPQKMFINGAWVSGTSGTTCDAVEPSTGGLLTRIPEASAADVDQAVRAARAQFDGGAWSRLKPLERERLL